MKQNIKLLTAIREAGLTQQEFAKRVKDDPSFVSRAIRGWFNLDSERKRRYSQVLGKPVQELFSE